jgi:ribosomal protein S18 acetylase RimI-like enzyme
MLVNAHEWTDAQAQRVRQIFFETSDKKSFVSEAQKNTFLDNYLASYLRESKQFCFLEASDLVNGYIVGSKSSESAVKKFAYYEVFQDCLIDYPAHLHINCAESAQGRGVGSKLLNKFKTSLEESNVCGLHIITSPEARNISFYKKNGFDFEITRNFKGIDLTLLGISLHPIDKITQLSETQTLT